RPAPGAPGPSVAPPTARGEPCAPPPLVVGTEASPGGPRLVRRPGRPIEAPRGEAAVERGGLAPRDGRAVATGAPGQRGAESPSRVVALGGPRGGRRGGTGGSAGSPGESQVARTRSLA